MGIKDAFLERLKDRDYLRWRRRRMFVRLALAVLTVVLLSPILILYKIYDVRSNLGFVFLAVCIFALMGIYRALGWIGRPYEPPEPPELESID